MKKNSVSQIIDRSSRDVFDLLHDYRRRLEWDTLLRKADLLNGAVKAGVGVRSLCAGRWLTGGIAMITEYLTFQRGACAAVKLINRPLFFRSFAATIRHRDLGEVRSEISYTYHFEAKPKWLAWLLEPIIDMKLRKETRKRLRALKSCLEKP